MKALLLCLMFVAAAATVQAQSAAGPTPEPITKGSVVDGVYTNSYFGFSMNLPKNWRVLSDDDATVAKNITSEELKSKDAKTNTEIDKAYTVSQTLLFCTKEPLGALENASIGAEARKQPSKYITAKMVVEATKSAYLKNPETKLTSDITPVEINGRTFQRVEFETKIGDRSYPMRFYVIVEKGYSIAFSLSSSEREFMTTAEAAIQTIKFTPEKK